MEPKKGREMKLFSRKAEAIECIQERQKCANEVTSKVKESLSSDSREEQIN